MGLLVIAMEVTALTLPEGSFKVAPFKLRAFKPMATPSVSVWPATMEVLKTSALVLLPET